MVFFKGRQWSLFPVDFVTSSLLLKNSFRNLLHVTSHQQLNHCSALWLNSFTKLRLFSLFREWITLGQTPLWSCVPGINKPWMNGYGEAPAIRQKPYEALSNSVSLKLRIYPVLVTIVLNMMSNYISSPTMSICTKWGIGPFTLWKRKKEKGKSFLHLRIHAGSSLCGRKKGKNSLATCIIAIKAFCSPLPVKGSRNNMPNGKWFSNEQKTTTKHLTQHVSGFYDCSYYSCWTPNCFKIE